MGSQALVGTLANALDRKLAEQGYVTKILDGDNIRSRLNVISAFLTRTAKKISAAFPRLRAFSRHGHRGFYLVQYAQA